jgi:ubiquinone/menaquinone biosynthesis C-methylase UbiE
MQTLSSDMPKIKEFIQLAGRTMLEIGCGDGRLSAQLADEVDTLTSIDPDEILIDQARKRIAGVNFQVGSGEQLEFENHCFDIVLFGYSLHHQDGARALTEARRVLRDDGCMLIIEPAPDGEYTRLVAVFQKNEIGRLQKTRAHIQSGEFQILRQDVYMIAYPFKDPPALYHYFLERYAGKDDYQAVEKMKAVLGGKTDERPIIVEDKINIFLIKAKKEKASWSR